MARGQDTSYSPARRVDWDYFHQGGQTPVGYAEGPGGGETTYGTYRFGKDTAGRHYASAIVGPQDDGESSPRHTAWVEDNTVSAYRPRGYRTVGRARIAALSAIDRATYTGNLASAVPKNWVVNR